MCVVGSPIAGKCLYTVRAYTRMSTFTYCILVNGNCMQLLKKKNSWADDYCLLWILDRRQRQVNFLF